MTVEKCVFPRGPLGWKVHGLDNWRPDPAFKGEEKEWAGCYVAFEQEVAKGYSEDCLDPDTGNGSAHIYRVSLNDDLNYILCTDKKIGKPEVSGSEKADLIRGALTRQFRWDFQGEPLMPWLGRKGYALVCYHDEEGNKEVIIPHRLTNSVVPVRFGIQRYQNWLPR